MLTFISGVDNGRKIPLHSPFTLGRSEDNDMFLADRKVSRNHAQLYQENGVWYVKDLNSSNGVYVNSTRIQEPVSLKENDDIIFGDTQAIFSFSEITPPAGAHISINFGAPSAAKCPHCGNEVKPDALFCGTCGKKISA
jgi:pSer/pThr/pTyr-binding forkhead associated (FHA) protein